MAALVHIAVGFVAKPLEASVPVGVSIVAAEILDILAIIFSLLGIESAGSIPWSHGLFMSFIWSLGFGALYFLIYRRFRTGIFISVLVFSHWVIDLVTHPMGAVFGGRPALPDLPLAFSGSPFVGLGLYNHSVLLAYLVEFSTLTVAVAAYTGYTVKNSRKRKTAEP